MIVPLDSGEVRLMGGKGERGNRERTTKERERSFKSSGGGGEKKRFLLGVLLFLKCKNKEANGKLVKCTI